MTTSNSKAATPKTQKDLLLALGLTRSKAVKKYGSKNLTYELRKEWEQREIETCESADQVAEVLATSLVAAVETAISECSGECSDSESSEQQPIDFDGLANILTDYVINMPVPIVEPVSESEPYSFSRPYRQPAMPVSMPISEYKPVGIELPTLEEIEHIEHINPGHEIPVKPKTKPKTKTIASVPTPVPVEESLGDILGGIAYYAGEWLMYTALKKIEKEAKKASRKASKFTIRFKLF